MLSPRFLALPAIALTVIVALSQAHSGAGVPDAAPSVLRAVNCALPAAALQAACRMARGNGAAIIR
jgi:hypothetical protein